MYMEISLGDIPMTHRIIPPYVCIYSRAYILLCVPLLLSFSPIRVLLLSLGYQ